MGIRGFVTGLVGLLMFAGFTTNLPAADIERLVMPGKVISGHAKYEADCEKCHVRFSKTTQGSLCLDCHDKVAADIRTDQGHHGRLHATGTDIDNCKGCHSDHLGRKADIISLDRDRFDHLLTDFPLKGAHKKTACTACHAEGKKFREAPPTCHACHQQIDPHKGRLGKDCADCHNTEQWSSQQFDHDKTEYPLKDGHQQVACNSCHPNQRYQKTPKDCYACHGLNDRHAGLYGEHCDNCHTPSDWKKTRFDHARDTHFALNGKHLKAACTACHSENPYRKKTPTACVTCHRNDDAHKARYGKECQNCHAEQGWSKVRFEHDKDTKFSLLGRHEKLLCSACHKGPVQDARKTTACVDCHQTDDVHQGKQGRQCQQCHNEQGWGEKLSFDHGLTRMPLIGMHAVAPCEECHLTADYKQAPLACNDCHQQDDVHKSRLPGDCGQCHNPNAWSLWRFDHDTATKFKLQGAHQGLDCLACHQQPVVKDRKLDDTCYSCHAVDDKHQGRFGKACERCHDTQAFNRITWPQ